MTTTTTLTALDRARKMPRPSREEMLARAPSVQRFWDDNAALFEDAWKDWEAENPALKLDSGIFAPALRDAVEAAWEDPTTEIAVRDLWKEVFPGVYEAQFLDPDRIADLRAYMEAVADAGIPTRPPYGISLNRGGAMLDPRSEGYLAAPQFQTFYDAIMNRYMRPISRLMFPDVAGYDSQTFGFSIRWQADKDTSLRPHTDASAVTLNINLNLPGETFEGSGVRYWDHATRQVKSLGFRPGIAMMHHGSVPHASEPITKGERFNFVLWTYGQHMQIPRPGAPAQDITPRERWSNPGIPSDGIAPF